LSKFPVFCPLNGPLSTKPLDLYKSESPSPKNGSYQVWLKLAWWFLRRSRLKEKLMPDRRRTTDRRTMDLRHGISSAGLWLTRVPSRSPGPHNFIGLCRVFFFFFNFQYKMFHFKYQCIQASDLSSEDFLRFSLFNLPVVICDRRDFI